MVHSGLLKREFRGVLIVPVLFSEPLEGLVGNLFRPSVNVLNPPARSRLS
jgi:hypothetical protein